MPIWYQDICNHQTDTGPLVDFRRVPGQLDLSVLNTLRPGQDGCQYPDDIFKYIFLNENVWISIEISRKCTLKGQINNIPALVQIMAWRRPGDKPLSEPMVISLLAHICVTRPQLGFLPCIHSDGNYAWNTVLFDKRIFCFFVFLTMLSRIPFFVCDENIDNIFRLGWEQFYYQQT